MNDESDILQKNFRVAQVIWVAILAALVIYAMVGNALHGRDFVDSESIPLELIRNILWAVTAATLIGSWILRKRMLAASGLDGPLSEDEAGARYRTVTMIGSGLCEAVGLFGLVLVLLGDSLQTLYLFVLVAAVAMLVHRPKITELECLAGGVGRG